MTPDAQPITTYDAWVQSWEALMRSRIGINWPYRHSMGHTWLTNQWRSGVTPTAASTQAIRLRRRADAGDKIHAANHTRGP